jgi:hypothetical protein
MPPSRLVPPPRSPPPREWGNMVRSHQAPPDTSLRTDRSEPRGAARDGTHARSPQNRRCRALQNILDRYPSYESGDPLRRRCLHYGTLAGAASIARVLIVCRVSNFLSSDRLYLSSRRKAGCAGAVAWLVGSLREASSTDRSVAVSSGTCSESSPYSNVWAFSRKLRSRGCGTRTRLRSLPGIRPEYSEM